MSTPKLSERLRAINDELELLGSMIAAERLTAIPENRRCTDEQLEITHKALDRCIEAPEIVKGDPHGTAKMFVEAGLGNALASSEVQGASGEQHGQADVSGRSGAQGSAVGPSAVSPSKTTEDANPVPNALTREEAIAAMTGGFSEHEKKHMLNSALSTASQVLMSAAVLVNAHEFLTGDVIFPDGSKWVLRFDRVRPPYTAPDSSEGAQPIAVESPEAAGRGLATESGVGLPADAPKEPGEQQGRPDLPSGEPVAWMTANELGCTTSKMKQEMRELAGDAFADKFSIPLYRSAPEVDVDRIMEVVKRVRPITDDCPRCDGMGCSGPCPPRYWEQPMRDELSKLLARP